MKTANRDIDRGITGIHSESWRCNLSPTLLQHLYWGLGFSIQQIADLSSWSGSAIYRRMNKFSIETLSSGNVRGKKHTEEELEKMSQNRIEWLEANPEYNMSGENNPMYGKTLGDEAKEKIRESRLGKSSWNAGLTKEIDKRVCESAKKLSVTRKRMIKSGEIDISKCLSNNYPTQPEKQMIDYIQRHEIPLKYNGQGQQFVIGGKIPDFVNETGTRVLEIFGRIWHDPDKAFIDIPYHQTQQGTLEHYKSMGVKCVIIWDDELGNNELISNKIWGLLN